MYDNIWVFIFLYNKKLKETIYNVKMYFSYSCFWIGGLKADCEPLPIIDGLWLLISNGNRLGMVGNGKRKEPGTNNGERKNCNQSVELRVTKDKGFDDDKGGGKGK